MKKTISLLMILVLLLGLCACGQKPEEEKEWSRSGYFSDENDNFLSVTWMEDVVEPGWYVGVMLGDRTGGWTLPQEGNSLHGNLNGGDESAEPFVVTLSEEGEDGLLLQVEGGESYHFKPCDMPEATILVTINTEGMGNIAYAEGEGAPEADPEMPFQSAQINLEKPETYTILAWPQSGYLFVKWQKDGADFSTEAQITVELNESADYVAVFEEDPAAPQLANPWREITEAEAKELCPESFTVPEGASDVHWRAMDSAEPAALVQLDFDLYGMSFTAREQVTGDPEADISGMYYDWTVQLDETLRNWNDTPCRSFRWIGEEGYADLCAWYDADSGTSYTVNVTSDDLDGFDLLAIAEALHG